LFILVQEHVFAQESGGLHGEVRSLRKHASHPPTQTIVNGDLAFCIFGQQVAKAVNCPDLLSTNALYTSSYGDLQITRPRDSLFDCDPLLQLGCRYRATPNFAASLGRSFDSSANLAVKIPTSVHQHNSRQREGTQA